MKTNQSKVITENGKKGTKDAWLQNDQKVIFRQDLRQKIKQLEMNSSEEISHCQEIIQKLQNVLESEGGTWEFVNKGAKTSGRKWTVTETEDLRKIALEAQKGKEKLKISSTEHEFSINEDGFEVQLREMEDSNQNAMVELRHLLVTQQKAANRWEKKNKETY